ncbi:MAG: preprotein translocase subunit YajC [Acidobacteriota bacterium]
MNTDTISSILLLIQQGGGGFGSLLVSLWPMLLIFGIFYFLLIRPQQKRQRQMQADRDQMLSSLKAGDKVITSGGIYGTIVTVREKEDVILLRIAQSVSIEIQRGSIAGLQGSETKETETAKQ